MGTRGIFGLKCNDTYKLKYNYYDSYPSDLGHAVVSFVKRVNTDNGWDQLRENCSNLQLVDPESKATPTQQEKYKEFSDLTMGRHTEPLKCKELKVDQLERLCKEKNDEKLRKFYRSKRKKTLPELIDYHGKKKSKLIPLCCGKPTAPSGLFKTIPPALWMWDRLLRKLQNGAALPEIYAGKLTDLPDESPEVHDSLSTQYGYVVNLDDMTLDLFEGFQRVPQKGNPFGTKVGYKSHAGDKYYPIRLVGKLPLDAIPYDWNVQTYPAEFSDAERVESLACNEKALATDRVTCDGVRMGQTIPPNCTVTNLNLGGCGLTKIPRQLQFLEFMETLALNDNQIKSIDIFDHRHGELPSLRTLDLQDNQIKQIRGIDDLKNLRTLTLDNNQIKKIEGIGKLPELTQVSLTNNSITSKACAAEAKKYSSVDITCGGR